MAPPGCPIFLEGSRGSKACLAPVVGQPALSFEGVHVSCPPRAHDEGMKMRRAAGS